MEQMDATDATDATDAVKKKLVKAPLSPKKEKMKSEINRLRSKITRLRSKITKLENAKTAPPKKVTFAFIFLSNAPPNNVNFEIFIKFLTCFTN